MAAVSLGSVFTSGRAQGQSNRSVCWSSWFRIYISILRHVKPSREEGKKNQKRNRRGKKSLYHKSHNPVRWCQEREHISRAGSGEMGT